MTPVMIHQVLSAPSKASHDYRRSPPLQAPIHQPLFKHYLIKFSSIKNGSYIANVAWAKFNEPDNW